MASESIAHKAEWAIDSEPIRARGIIVKYILHTVLHIFSVELMKIVNSFSHIQDLFTSSFPLLS